MTVQYEITEAGWVITETHLAVELAIKDIPQTKKGNPIPGQFPEGDSFNPPVTEVAYTFDYDDNEWESGDSLYVAAHAVVVFLDETYIDFESLVEFDEVNNISTSNGDISFYMTDYTSLSNLAVGDSAALTPSGNLPIVASPGTNDNPSSTYSNIAAFTVGGPPYTGNDDIVTDDHGTGAGGNTLTDPQDQSILNPLMWHAYSNFEGIVIDFSDLDLVVDAGFVTIDLDHGEIWHFMYFDADGVLINHDLMGAGTGSYDGEAFPTSWTDDQYSIAKVVIFGEMNSNAAGIVGYAIDNVCVTSVVQEETAWGAEEQGTTQFGGKNWATYFCYVSNVSIVTTYDAGGILPYPICYANGYVWVANGYTAGPNAVSKIDVLTGVVVDTYTVAIGPYGICYGDGYIWVANYGTGSPYGNTVSKIDPSNGNIDATITVETGPYAICYGDGYVWVTSLYTANKMNKIDTFDNSVVSFDTVGNNPYSICYGDGYVWTADAFTNDVTKINATTNAIVGTYPVGNHPQSICFDGTNIWVANQDDDTVMKVDAATGVVVDTYDVGNHPSGICFDGIAIWVTNMSDDTVSMILD